MERPQECAQRYDKVALLGGPRLRFLVLIFRVGAAFEASDEGRSPPQRGCRVGTPGLKTGPYRIGDQSRSRYATRRGKQRPAQRVEDDVQAVRGSRLNPMDRCTPAPSSHASGW